MGVIQESISNTNNVQIEFVRANPTDRDFSMLLEVG